MKDHRNGGRSTARRGVPSSWARLGAPPPRPWLCRRRAVCCCFRLLRLGPPPGRVSARSLTTALDLSRVAKSAPRWRRRRDLLVLQSGRSRRPIIRLAEQCSDYRDDRLGGDGGGRERVDDGEQLGLCRVASHSNSGRAAPACTSASRAQPSPRRALVPRSRRYVRASRVRGRAGRTNDLAHHGRGRPHPQAVLELAHRRNGQLRQPQLPNSAPPDGHTLLFVTPVNAINATLYGGLTFTFTRDIAPVAGLVSVPFVLVVNPTLPIRNVAELIDYTKANPGKISFGSAGVGSVPHMAGELFKLMAGVDMLHVPYRGSAPALTDLIAGHVQVMFDAIPASLPHVRSGALRALAVTTSVRSSALAKLPAAAETVPGYETSSWYGVGAPKDTPREIIERLNREIAAGLENPIIKEQLAEANAAPMPLPSAQFAKHIASETEKAKVVRAVSAKAD